MTRPAVTALVATLSAAALFTACERTPPNKASEVGEANMSIYEIETKTLEGKPASLSEYRGQVALLVNVASECGYTPQYAGLQKLYERFKAQGFVVLGFPSNDFGKQEPGSAEEIRAFCSSRYRVDFPMLEKVVTKAGPQQSPVYAALGKSTGSLPEWNFGKYLVGRNGKVLKFYPSDVKPEDASLVQAIEGALAAGS
ncbi:MAG: glutathione peroxidase family protein [Polyangiaceae bacterium]|jgi:glutathione peroxidase|nr:glutathione peroxidase family protein [Polyangiaceae bacterium]